jgi:gas vesicle protein
METSKSTAKIIVAIVAGALTGAALGILFAPHKGSKTRRKLINGAKDLVEDIGEKIKEGVSSLISKAEDIEELAEEKAQDIVNNVKQKSVSFKHVNAEQEMNQN